MIKIEHIAIWAQDLEQLKDFYVTYFGATASAQYRNAAKAFTSYFLTFDSGARLELMHRPGLGKASDKQGAPLAGYAHLAFSVGSEETVDRLTAQLEQEGYQVTSGPRYTGDGYYESVVLDPEGNTVEITE